MEQFLSQFGQHVTSFFNLKAMVWVNTGDRMMDTTIQMMVSTITAALVGGLLALYKNRGLLTDIKQSIKCFFKRGAYNPLDFDPSLADRKPLNGKIFLYRVNMLATTRRPFINWFMENHRKKIYNLEKLEANIGLDSIDMELRTSSSNPSKFSHFSEFPDMKLNKETFLPVWKDKNGYWVYLTTLDNPISWSAWLLSDSYEAIENCLRHVKEFQKKKDSEDPDLNGKPKAMGLFEIDNKEGTLTIKTSDLPINKTFDSLFFEQKESLLPILNGFKEKTLFPKHLPVDNKLGIILHGPPGTGKTGFITALANLLERNVKLVDMTKITTRTALDNILRNDKDTCIYVFEEFDTVPSIQKREKKSDAILDSAAMKSPEMMMMAMASSKDNAMMEEYKKEMEAAKDKIDLGYLLRKLDGLESADNRIIVATTNHPERIDPALLRPGRFGIQVNLGKATKKMIRDIVGMIYQTEVSEGDVEGIPEKLWSPAEILQEGLLYSNPKKLLSVLREKIPTRD